MHRIDLISTLLDTPDYRRIIIPNSSVFGTTTENVPLRESHRLKESALGAVAFWHRIEQERAFLSPEFR